MPTKEWVSAFEKNQQQQNTYTHTYQIMCIIFVTLIEFLFDGVK